MNTWAIADVLRASGARVVISNPMRTRAIAEARVKTDKVDALTLAQLLAADFVPEVWAPDEEIRRLRREVAARAALVRQRTQARNRIHAVLDRCLEDAPVADLFGAAGRTWLAALALPEAERAQLEATLRVHEAIEAEIELADRRLAEIALADERVDRLMSLPGVGATIALSLIALIGGVARFRRPAKLVGLSRPRPEGPPVRRAPSLDGEHQPRRPCPRPEPPGRSGARRVGAPGPLRAFSRRVERRRGTQVALVAVARKLAVLTWYVLTTGERYRFERATLVRDKRNRFARTLGQSTPRRRPAKGQPSLAVRREFELAVLAEAEAAYKADVAKRTQKDAAAANGVQL